jgi:hypothetical protein
MVFSFFSFFFGFFLVFSVCFGASVVTLLYQNREFRLIRNKQKTHPKQVKREYIWVFFRKFRVVVSVCYETVLFVSVVSIWVRNTETNRNFWFLFSRNKPKQTRNRSCFGLFRFEPKIIFVCFEDTLLESN